MKIIAIVLTALMSACFAVRAAEPARIDGSTDTSFDTSFSKLVKSLKAPERRTLALGLFGALIRHECLSPEAVIALTFSPVEPKDAPRIRPCRAHLDGKSYEEIMQAAEPPPASSTQEAA
ncbi:hypothetical protein ACW7G0_13960 [Lysobacter sp. A286]